MHFDLLVAAPAVLALTIQSRCSSVGRDGSAVLPHGVWWARPLRSECAPTRYPTRRQSAAQPLQSRLCKPKRPKPNSTIYTVGSYLPYRVHSTAVSADRTTCILRCYACFPPPVDFVSIRAVSFVTDTHGTTAASSSHARSVHSFIHLPGIPDSSREGLAAPRQRGGAAVWVLGAFDSLSRPLSVTFSLPHFWQEAPPALPCGIVRDRAPWLPVFAHHLCIPAVWRRAWAKLLLHEVLQVRWRVVLRVGEGDARLQALQRHRPREQCSRTLLFRHHAAPEAPSALIAASMLAVIVVTSVPLAKPDGRCRAGAARIYIVVGEIGWRMKQRVFLAHLSARRKAIHVFRTNHPQQIIQR